MSTAFIDFLGVTFWMSPDNARFVIETILKGWLGVEARIVETGKGWNGYTNRLDIDGVGLVAFGGNGDTIHIELTGQGCVQVKDWEAVRESLALLEGRITRLDIAVDDHDGTTYNLPWVRAQYEAGQFDPARGCKPVPRLIDDMGSGKGSTFYLGSRESGKLFRGYEKGKQLGDPESPWFRCEVEWRNRHREIPLDALTDPGRYFAGAYKAFEHHSLEQSQIKTVAHVAKASIQALASHAKKQAGRCIHALLTLGHTADEVLSILHTPELPKRLAGHVRAFLALDESERTYSTATAPAWAAKATPEELDNLYKAHRLQRGVWRVGQGTNGTHEHPAAANGAPLPALS